MKLVIGSIIAILLLLLGAILHTDAGQRQVLRTVQKQLAEKQNIELEASNLDYNLLFLQLSLKDVSLRVMDRPEPFLRADSISLDFGITRLPAKVLTLNDAKLDGLDVNLIVNEDGEGNWPSGSEEEEPAKEDSGWKPLIESLALNGGSFTFEDRSQEYRLSLPAISARIQGSAATLSHDVRLSTGSAGEVTYQGRSAAIDRIGLGAGIGADAVDIREFEVAAAGSSVRANGTVRGFEQPVLDTDVDLQLALAELTTLAGVEGDIGGNLTADLQVEGSTDDLQVDGSVGGDALGWRGLRDFTVRADAGWNMSDERVSLRDLEVAGPAGRITGDVALALGEDGGESSFAGRLRGINLLAIGRALELPVAIATRLGGSVEAQWDGMDFETLRIEARNQLQAIDQTVSKDRIPLSGELQTSGGYDSLRIRVQRLATPGAELQGTVDLARFESLGGSLELQAETGQLSTTAASFLDKSGEFAEVAGDARLTAKLGGTVSAPTADVSLAAPELSIAEYDGVSVAADVGYTPEQVRVEQARVGWQGEEVRVAGTVGLGADDAQLELRAEMDQVQLAAMLAAVGSDLPVQGSVNLDANVGGTINAPTATVTLDASSLEAFGETLGALGMEASYGDQTLVLSELRLRKSPGDPASGVITASGRYGVESQTYELSAKADRYPIKGLSLPGEVGASGVLSLEASGSGSVEEPGLQLSLNLGELDLAGRELGELTAEARVAGGTGETTIEAPKLGLATTASIALDAPHRTKFQLNLDNTDLGLLGVTGPEGEPVRGAITAQIDGSGPLDTPVAGTLNAAIRALRVAAAGVEVENSAPARLAWRDRRITVESLELTTGATAVAVGGSLPLETATGDQLTVDAKLDLAEVTALAPPDAGVSGEGTVEVAGTVGGTLQKPEPAVNIQMSGRGVSHTALNEPLSGLSLEAVFEEGSVVIRRLQASIGESRLEARGRVPVSDTDETATTLEASLSAFDLTNLSDVPENLSGMIGFSAEATIPDLAEWQAMDATVRFDQLEMQVADFALTQSEPTEFNVRDEAVHISKLLLTGPDTRLEGTGSAGLGDPGALDVRLSGDLDARIAALFNEEVQASGPVQFQLAAGGTTKAPELTGFLEMNNGDLALPAADVIAESLDLRLDLTPEEIRLSRLRATFNGGPMSGSGIIGYSSDGIESLGLGFAIRNAFLEVPEGLKTQVQATITARTQEEDIVIGGQVMVLEGSYREFLDVQGQLLDAVGQSRRVRIGEERNEFLERLQFDVAIDTKEQIAIDNNLMEALVSADLRLHGNPTQLGLTGRIQIQEGSELYINERRYFVENGIITFVNERSIQPELDILARTKASGYEIRLQLSGGEEDYEATFTSDPPLSEPDIVSVLMTGRTLDQARGAELNIAKEQALSYLGGQAASRLSRSAQETLGLSTVRIEPNLISAESDPSARLTLGQDITNDLRFVYSMNLVEAQDQVQILEYDVTKRFLARGTRQEDNTGRFDFEHGFQFGGAPVEDEGPLFETGELDIGEIKITGEPVFSEAEIRDKLGLETGKKYQFFKVQDKLDKLRDYYHDRDRLEARVRVRRQENEKTIDLTFDIQAGPQVSFVFEGYGPGGGVRKKVRRTWIEGFAEQQRIRETTELLEQELYREGFVEAEVECDIRERSEDSQQVLYTVTTGQRFGSVELVFQGADSIDKEILEEIIENEGGMAELRPGDASNRIEAYYRQQGFLNVEVQQPRTDLNRESGSAEVIFEVAEGPQFTVGSIEFAGNEAFDDKQLLSTTGVPTGAPYRAEALDTALSRIEELYWTNGYQEVEIDYAIEKSEEAAIKISFDVNEGRRRMVESVSVEGTHLTSEKFVRRQLEIESGEALDYRETNQSRRNLYHLGAYSLVDIQTEPDPTGSSDLQVPVAVRVKVRERKPYDIRYGGSYDTDRGPGFIFDFSNRNLLGAARVIGTRVRYDPDFRELRGYFSQPLLRRLPVSTSITGFTSREILDTFITDRTGFSIQQEYQLDLNNIFSVGYRFERTDTFDKDPDSIFQVPPFNVAPLTFTWTRTTRDDFLDATRGSFTTHGVEWAPSPLGSDVQFARYLGQIFKYFPLKEPAPVPFGGGATRSRLVFATGARVGLAQGLGGQDLVRTERFFVGGSTTVRGFPANSIGPSDFFGATGGDAMFILNNELRFPIYKMFDGVGFLDMGNVYRGLSDFNPLSLRKSSGFGLRVRTPYVLLRFDYGFILDRKTGEPVGGFHFSIGQAF